MSPDDSAKATQRHFDQELNDLRELLLRMAGRAEEQMRSGLTAVKRLDAQAAQQAIFGDRDVDALEPLFGFRTVVRMLFLVESKMSRIVPYFCAALFMVAGVSKAFLPATAVMALEGLGLSRSLAEAVVLVVASFEIYLATNLLVFPNF